MSGSAGLRPASQGVEYFAGANLAGAEEDEWNETSLNALRRHASDLQFDSLLEAALLSVERGDEAASSDAVARLSACYLRSLKGKLQDLPTEAGRVLCQPATEIYRAEFKALTANSTFRQPLNQFSAEYIAEFSFESLYNAMARSAPVLSNYSES
jgi:hypothetical protein